MVLLCGIGECNFQALYLFADGGPLLVGESVLYCDQEPVDFLPDFVGVEIGIAVQIVEPCPTGGGGRAYRKAGL